jgi:hypothetical protein
MTLVDWVAAAVIVGGLLFLRRRIASAARAGAAVVRGAPKWVRARPPLGLVLAITLSVVAAVLLAWKVPLRQLADVRPEAVEPVTSSKEYFELLNAYRATIVQALGGLVLLLTLYLTWRRVAATERQVVIAGEGQITERFTRAIDQLGSKKPDGNTNLEVALGGIYALERIARDSEKDHWPIMEVLTAYVRERSPAPKEAEDDKRQGPEPVATDIQAILTVIGRRRVKFDPPGQDLDLRGTSLRGANLSGANLARAYLRRTNLSRANLFRADLRETRLSNADLREANLHGANLSSADLSGADLSGADLHGADLSGADASGANLSGANLSAVNLSGVSLYGAHLSLADLSLAYLRGVDLSEARGLTREQIESADTDETTMLPDYLEEGGEGPAEEAAGGEG